jgi:hypothetical protein
VFLLRDHPVTVVLHAQWLKEQTNKYLSEQTNAAA